MLSAVTVCSNSIRPGFGLERKLPYTDIGLCRVPYRSRRLPGRGHALPCPAMSRRSSQWGLDSEETIDNSSLGSRAEEMKRKQLNSGTVLVFDTGDEVVSTLTKFAKERRIAVGHFTAIGAFSDAGIGYVDLQRKEYLKKPSQ